MYKHHTKDNAVRYVRNLVAFLIQLTGRTTVIPIAIAIFFGCFLTDPSNGKVSTGLGSFFLISSVIISIYLAMFSIPELKYHCAK